MSIYAHRLTGSYLQLGLISLSYEKQFTRVDKFLLSGPVGVLVVDVEVELEVVEVEVMTWNFKSKPFNYTFTFTSRI